ncbi:MAG TPA: hypothetical protein VLI54_02335 [Bacillota bacterium]|nr:hypothetical protein [Bacillota bacterium]
MDSLQELLNKYSPQEPPEVLAIKQFVSEQFGADSSVGINGETLVITVRSAALANALRLRLPALKAAVQTNKRFIFRIG